MTKESEPKKPTICAECAHFIFRRYTLDDCAARPEIHFVSGGPIYEKCFIRNRGCCPDFEPKPPSWWRRIFGAQK